MERAAGLAVLATLLTFAPHAAAQEPDLSVVLTDGVRCTASARNDIVYNIKKSAAVPGDIGAALNLIAADQARCSPVREAATALAAGYVAAAPAPAPEERQDEQNRAIVAQTLAEADRQAAQLRFEVGPPPRNMTRGIPERR
jgi:hypothetical protein